ncbi:hypothetical protein M011DRAFT_87022 [Sporormia fimetaria CBS 119925]|uniref:Uncharacterized protein n=1 Tax=Sporormia fimetaria CBS 119925 TaxID=1340428 RepID=A0A6A6V7P6_9PLEO|nr:hypothetical protein M011DRAFT_87022 [Sporormia fimetaria CBS 119925]
MTGLELPLQLGITLLPDVLSSCWSPGVAAEKRSAPAIDDDRWPGLRTWSQTSRRHSSYILTAHTPMSSENLPQHLVRRARAGTARSAHHKRHVLTGQGPGNKAHCLRTASPLFTVRQLNHR